MKILAKGCQEVKKQKMILGKGITNEKYEKWVQWKAQILDSFGEIRRAFHCKGFFETDIIWYQTWYVQRFPISQTRKWLNTFFREHSILTGL